MVRKFIKLVFMLCFAFMLVLMVAHGQPPSEKVIDLDTGEESVRILGDDADDWSGFSVSSGDINGDGYADVIISANKADPAGGANAGEVYVIFGSASPKVSKDLNSSSANMKIHGDDAGDECGRSLSSGDINGDGFDDIIIGAYKADPAGGSNAGEAYVIFGSATPRRNINLNLKAADMTIYGDDDNDFAGRTVSSGDINGDGYADVIIGAHKADPAGGADAGETYVIFGSPAPPATVDLNSELADMIIYGDDAGDYSGRFVSSGDINGDGYDDVIIGANNADPAGGANAGETYVILGSATPPATIDLNSSPADMVIYGDDAGDGFGRSVSSGDIDGDGYDDVIIGAHYADPAGGADAGETYVILGSATPPATIDLNDSPSPADMIIYGADTDDYSGSSVFSGDINGDGYDDVIIGANRADTAGGIDVGETYVIFGSPAPSATVDLNSESADMTIHGDDAGDASGNSVSSGDFNGDGFDDIITGAYYASPAGGISAGETYVVFGGGLPIGYDFFDTDISDWLKMGTGNAIVKNEQLLMRNTTSYLSIFPAGAVSNECDIEAKVTRIGGTASRLSSSIIFNYKDNKNYWELRMHLNAVGARIPGQWILRCKKDGIFERKQIIIDDINRSQQYFIKIEVRENLISVFVDGQKIMEQITKEKPSWGKIALRYQGAGTAFFDDLVIQ
jgi:hypothetical protein